MCVRYSIICTYRTYCTYIFVFLVICTPIRIIIHHIMYDAYCVQRRADEIFFFFFSSRNTPKNSGGRRRRRIKTARLVSEFNKSPRGDGGHDDAHTRTHCTHTHDLRGAGMYPRESLSKLPADNIILLQCITTYTYTRDAHDVPSTARLWVVVFTYYYTHVIDNKFFFFFFTHDGIALAPGDRSPQ